MVVLPHSLLFVRCLLPIRLQGDYVLMHMCVISAMLIAV